MLVVISDLHFVDGTAGEHNLNVGAFKDVFLSDIASLAKDKKAKEIKVLLLGDIVDLIRSEQWFLEKIENRPWGLNGLADVLNPRQNGVTEKRCLAILGKMPSDGKKPAQAKSTILYKNWETFEFFRNFQKHLNDDYKLVCPVELIYVPGNHDRLCNLYPSLRDWMKDALGLTVTANTVEGDPHSEWWYKYDYKVEDYGVYARHGHQFDPINYGGDNDHTRPAQLKASIGDVFTTEFAVKLPYVLRQNPKATPELIESLKDMDNVRPLSAVMEWFYYQVKSQDKDKNREALEETFDAVVKELLDIDLVKEWRSPKTHMDELIRAASSRWLNWLTKAIVDKLDAEDLLPLFVGGSEGAQEPEKDDLARGAYYEQIWKTSEKIQFILYGHTHAPMQIPLDRLGSREVIYINTGTWRDRIYRSIKLDQAPDFVSLKQMTYVVFFKKDEDTQGKSKGTISFDIWTGNKKKLYA